MKYKRQINLNHQKQQGGALIISVFILVVMSLLGVSLSRMLASGGDAVAWEVLGNRALMAADSAGEMAMFQLFPPGQATNTCFDVNDKINNFPAGTGLSNCSATLSCREFDQVSLGSHHYQITATGRCQAGNQNNIDALRTIELEARTLIP